MLCVYFRSISWFKESARPPTCKTLESGEANEESRTPGLPLVSNPVKALLEQIALGTNHCIGWTKHKKALGGKAFRIRIVNGFLEIPEHTETSEHTNNQ